MFLNKPYTLSVKDVFTTIHTHVRRYKNFVYTQWEVMSDFFSLCVKRSRKHQKLMILFH